jgi:predicted transcriptional regulator
MSNEALKLELIAWLTRLQDQEILDSLHLLKKRSEGGFENDIMAAERIAAYEHKAPRPTSREDDWFDRLTDEQKASIERGRQDIAAGRVISSEELWKKYGKTR